MSKLDNILAGLRQGIAEGHAPGAVACVGNREGILFLQACGNRQTDPQAKPAEKNTVYDLASLTKVVATTTALLLLRERGEIDIEAPVSDYLPIPPFRFLVRHCMTHSAGLIPGANYYENASGLIEMLQRYSGLKLNCVAGSWRKYSDVSYMILGKLVELVARDSLDDFCARMIWRPLGMADTGFKPPAAIAARCAATERDAGRGGVIVGKVHDPNAFAVGGVSGHAGLFSSAGDLAKFCQAFLNGKILSDKTIQDILQPGRVPTYPWQGLGWKIDPFSCSIEGHLPSRRALGHTGWTGTSIWMDYDSGLYAILLGNTCHPSQKGKDSKPLRRRFYTAVSREFYSRKINVHTGLDRVVWDGFEALHGKRIALLTNTAAVDQLGRPILDVLALDPNVNLKIIYTPEHGLTAAAEAGAQIANQQARTPARIISLYGEQRAPTTAELADIDLFVVDLQDVGSRWYTYMATMLDCMRSCVKARKPVLVLDRPNPAGGIMEGPIPAQYGGLTCCAPIPSRHGMTMGELAYYFRDNMLDKKVEVSVSLLDGWRPDLFYEDCCLPWVPPSPNIPTPRTALLYAGMCLFEATNLNEGRGTEFPFEVVGAPWLNPTKVLEHMPADATAGVRLSPTEYTPRSIQGKSANPRFCNTACRGVKVELHDLQKARPFWLAVALIVAVQKCHRDKFSFDLKDENRIMGKSIHDAIEGGASAADIINQLAPALAKFDAIRPKLYC